MSEVFKHITPDEFNDAINQAENVIIKIETDECQPCARMNAVLEKVAADTGVTVFAMNASQPDVAAFVRAKGVRTVPTMLNHKKGELVGIAVSEHTYEGLVKKFDL